MKEEKQVITVETKDQTEEVNTALLSKIAKTIDMVFEENDVLKKGYSSEKSKPLVKLSEFKFGDNEQKKTRRPQGVAKYGNYVINSWYFTSESKWDGNCKLTVTDTTKNLYINLVPVTLNDAPKNEKKFVHIDSHAGGLAVIDDYLYMANGKSILIFDLSKIYPIHSDPDPTIAPGQKFIYEYANMIPQVGEINFVASNVFGSSNMSLAEQKLLPVTQDIIMPHASYMSLAEINSQQYFLIGNFYSAEKSEYEYGGKAMIWIFPVVKGNNLSTGDNLPFATIKMDIQNPDYYQIEPLFPSGDEKNKTITRIQGAIIRDNILIVNRSYSDHTYQLIVMKYSKNLNVSSELVGFFSGTNKDKHSYNNKNWLYGCEDLEYDNIDKKILTVTEFGDRSIYSAAYDDILNLLV